MTKSITPAAFATLVMLACASPGAHAAQCGSGPGGFEAWKQQFAQEARAKGVGATGVSALMAANYASATIAADRGQRSFRLSLDAFLAKRGASTIVARGRQLKQSQAAMFASIQQRYGVPPGRCLRSGAWRPVSAASTATRTCSPRSQLWPMTAVGRNILPSSFLPRCN